MKRKKGISTRTKHKELPMYVYMYDVPTSKKKFRVCRKVNGETKTFGYFHKMFQAARLARKITNGNIRDTHDI